MGQITNPGSKGITVNPIDRQSGPGAGAGATGNNSIFLGQNAGLNASASQLIIIGNNSGKGGITSVGGLNGTVIVGAQSAEALTAGAVSAGAMTIIGNNILQAAPNADNSVLIGQGILQFTTDVNNFITQNVLIGNGIAVDATTQGALHQCVVIGFNANNKTGNSNSVQNTVIGCQAFANNLGSNSANVFIGYLAAQNAGDTGLSGVLQNVVIGALADIGTNSGGNVLIGYNAVASASSSIGSNVGIGNSCSAMSGTGVQGKNVVIGGSARVPSNETVGGNVIIGWKAGQAENAADPTVGNILVIGTNQVSQRNLIYGLFNIGNLVLGNSISGTNQDTQGTNTVKLLNGTKGGAAPIGGGYFYVIAGALHWVGSAGTD